MCALILQFRFGNDLNKVVVQFNNKNVAMETTCYLDMQRFVEQTKNGNQQAAELFNDKNACNWGLQFGAFGEGYAGGAARIQFSYTRHGKCVVMCTLESDPVECTPLDTGTFHFVSDTAQVDDFLVQLQAVISEEISEAALHGTSLTPSSDTL